MPQSAQSLFPVWSRLEDHALVEALGEFAESLPLAAAQECLNRLDRLAPQFEQLVRNPESWLRLDCGHWPVIHAWLILAQSGREEFGGALFEGARHFIPLDVYRRFWFEGDSTMATFPSSFLAIMAEAAADSRLGVAIQNCGTLILGVALLQRPEHREERAEALYRVLKNPETEAHTRSLALRYILDSRQPRLLERLHREPAPDGIKEDAFRAQIQLVLAGPPREVHSPKQAFAFYKSSEVDRRIRYVHSHRDTLIGETRFILACELDADSSRALSRFAASFAARPPEDRAAHVLPARWILARQILSKQSLDGLTTSRLAFLLHRFVYHRRQVEQSSRVDFWDALDTALDFLALDRGISPERSREWHAVISLLRRGYGDRAGF